MNKCGLFLVCAVLAMSLFSCGNNKKPESKNEVKKDTVIAAVGSTLAYKQGYDMLKPLRGKLVIFPAGYPKPELHVDPNELHYRKMEIIGSFVANVTDWYESATLISKRLIDCSYSLEGKYIPLRDIQQAYEAAATPDAYRVTVDLQSV